MEGGWCGAVQCSAVAGERRAKKLAMDAAMLERGQRSSKSGSDGTIDYGLR